MEKLIVLIVCGLAAGQRNTYSGNPNGVVFPGPISSSNRQSYSRKSPATKEVQFLELAMRLDEADSFDDILEMVDGIPEDEKDVLLNTRIGDLERTSALKPKPAKCIPELQSVPFHSEVYESSAVYFPSCTRIKRCGGCCSHPLLSCEPVTSETRNFVVLVMKVEENNGVSYKNKEIIPLEEHTSCRCFCKIKPEHCTERQHYVEEECRCKCVNSDEEAKCRQSNNTKLWDPDACACLCRIIEDCNTGFEFDHNTCSCRLRSTQRNYGRGTNYKHGARNGDAPPVIVPLDPSDPRRKHKDEPNY